jgi:hypothetical protein
MSRELSTEEWENVTNLIHSADVDALESLLKENPDFITGYGPNGYNILHYAVLKDNKSDALRYLASPDSAIDVNVRTFRAGNLGDTPLLVASIRGEAEGVEILLKNPKTDVNLKSASGNTALVLATYGAEVDIVKVILKKSLSPVDLFSESENPDENPIICAERQVTLYEGIRDEEKIERWKTIISLIEGYESNREVEGDLVNKVSGLDVSSSSESDEEEGEP